MTCKENSGRAPTRAGAKQRINLPKEANTMKNIHNSRSRRKASIAPLPLFEFARERDFCAMPQPARWVARRFRVSPALAVIVAEQALLGGRE